jgi:hypothetical protein
MLTALASTGGPSRAPNRSALNVFVPTTLILLTRRRPVYQWAWALPPDADPPSCACRGTAAWYAAALGSALLYKVYVMVVAIPCITVRAAATSEVAGAGAARTSYLAEWPERVA